MSSSSNTQPNPRPGPVAVELCFDKYGRKTTETLTLTPKRTKINLKATKLGLGALTSLPPTFGRLTWLVELDVSDHWLTRLPEEFELLQSLKVLNVNQNKLFRFPTTICNLTSLEELYFCGNSLKSLPDEIDGMSSLKKLVLFNNKLQSLPSSIGNLTSLEDLNLCQNRLQKLPDSMGNMSSLKNLNIRSNELRSIPASFSNLMSLECVVLDGNSFPLEIRRDVSIGTLLSKKPFRENHIEYLDDLLEMSTKEDERNGPALQEQELTTQEVNSPAGKRRRRSSSAVHSTKDSTTVPQETSPSLIDSDSKGSAAKQALDEAIESRQLTDLHAHLMGMGSAEFWVSEIMCNQLRSMCNEEQECATKEGKEAYQQAKSSRYFTKDVVFDVGSLARALSRSSPDKLADGHAKEIVVKTLAIFNTAEGNEKLVDHIKQYTIFDARKQKLKSVLGIVNDVLSKAIETNRDLRDLFVHAFEMNVGDPAARDLFHNHFTPEFYPRRFILKDAIYAQRPVVLEHLMNYVCARYANAGVGYAELSVGLGDINRPWMWAHLTSKERLSEEAKKVDVRFLAAFGRQACLLRVPKKDEPGNVVEQALQKVQDEIKHLKSKTNAEPPKLRELRAELQRVEGINEEALSEARKKTVVARLTKEIDEFESDGSEPALSSDETYKLTWLQKAEKAIWRVQQLMDDRAKVDGSVEMPYRVVAAVMLLAKEESATNHHYEMLFDIKERDALVKVLEKVETGEFGKLLVGVDLVGDESKFAFSPYSAYRLAEKIANVRDKLHGYFGLRLHAGELSPSPKPEQAANEPHVRAHLAAVAHSVTQFHYVMKNIVFDRHKTNLLRIGHGVLFTQANSAQPREDNSRGDCTKAVEALRELLPTGVAAIEINITSNLTLIDNSFGIIQKFRASARSATHHLPLVLATDDDGIWRCDVELGGKIYHSVACEFVKALKSGVSADELRTFVADGLAWKFSKPSN